MEDLIIETDDYKKSIFTEFNFSTVKELADNGLNLNLMYNEVTLLNTVCQYGNLDLVRFLVNRGADINKRNDKKYGDYYSPIETAISFGKNDIVKYLYSNGSEEDPSYPLIVLAAKFKNLEIVSFLLDIGKDINSVELDTYRTCLHFAVFNEDIIMCSFLIQSKCGINGYYQYTQGWTALHVSVVLNNYDITLLLLNSGADINDPGELYNETPLDIAINNYWNYCDFTSPVNKVINKKIINLLISCGGKQKIN